MALVSEPNFGTMHPNTLANMALLTNRDMYVNTLPECHKEALVALLQDAIWQLDILAEIAGVKQQDKKHIPSLPTAVLTKRNASDASLDHVKIAKERTTLQHLLKKAMLELKQGHVHSLINAVEEEKSKRNLLNDTLKREKELNLRLRDLQRQLSEEQRTLEREREERETVLLQLREAIQEILALTASEQKYLRKETRARETSVHVRYVRQEEVWAARVQRLARKLDVELRVHATLVDFLNRQRGVLETQIEHWMERHETDTERKAAELETCKATRAAAVEAFEELAAKYEELERWIDDDRLQKARAQEQKAMRVSELRRTTAAKKIQAWWRVLKGLPPGGHSGGNSAAGTRGSGSPAGERKSTGKRSTASASKKGAARSGTSASSGGTGSKSNSNLSTGKGASRDGSGTNKKSPPSSK